MLDQKTAHATMYLLVPDHMSHWGPPARTGATEAARGAADIVLTEPGLSTICSAVIGARKIFQRMTTYAKYTVAMTFRICFTFGILTVVYNWCLLPPSLLYQCSRLSMHSMF